MTKEQKEFFGIFAALCKKYNVKAIVAVSNAPIIIFENSQKGDIITFDYDSDWSECGMEHDGCGMRIKETNTEFIKV